MAGGGRSDKECQQLRRQLLEAQHEGEELRQQLHQVQEQLRDAERDVRSRESQLEGVHLELARQEKEHHAQLDSLRQEHAANTEQTARTAREQERKELLELEQRNREQRLEQEQADVIALKGEHSAELCALRQEHGQKLERLKEQLQRQVEVQLATAAALAALRAQAGEELQSHQQELAARTAAHTEELTAQRASAAAELEQVRQELAARQAECAETYQREAEAQRQQAERQLGEVRAAAQETLRAKAGELEEQRAAEGAVLEQVQAQLRGMVDELEHQKAVLEASVTQLREKNAELEATVAHLRSEAAVDAANVVVVANDSGAAVVMIQEDGSSVGNGGSVAEEAAATLPAEAPALPEPKAASVWCCGLCQHNNPAGLEFCSMCAMRKTAGGPLAAAGAAVAAAEERKARGDEGVTKPSGTPSAAEAPNSKLGAVTPRTLLWVDDTPANNDVLAETAKAQGIEVHMVPSSGQALDFLHQHAPLVDDAMSSAAPTSLRVITTMARRCNSSAGASSSVARAAEFAGTDLAALIRHAGVDVPVLVFSYSGIEDAKEQIKLLRLGGVVATRDQQVLWDFALFNDDGAAEGGGAHRAERTRSEGKQDATHLADGEPQQKMEKDPELDQQRKALLAKKWRAQLAQMEEMGVSDHVKLVPLLAKHKGNVHRVLLELFDE